MTLAAIIDRVASVTGTSRDEVAELARKLCGDIERNAGIDMATALEPEVSDIRMTVSCVGDRDVRADYLCPHGCPGPQCADCPGRKL